MSQVVPLAETPMEALESVNVVPALYGAPPKMKKYPPSLFAPPEPKAMQMYALGSEEHGAPVGLLPWYTGAGLS
jgi:hypothetical protein